MQIEDFKNQYNINDIESDNFFFQKLDTLRITTGLD